MSAFCFLSAKAKSPSLSGCPLQKGGETNKKQRRF